MTRRLEPRDCDGCGLFLSQEVAMSDWSGPPFRVDHIGSLLHPPDLLRARAEHQAGRVSADELRRVEDRAIQDAVRMPFLGHLPSISTKECAGSARLARDRRCWVRVRRNAAASVPRSAIATCNGSVADASSECGCPAS